MKDLYKLCIAGSLLTTLFYGCEKNSEENIFSEYDIVDQTANAFIKVNYNVAYYNNPGVQIKINGTRVSGSNIQTRYPFPGGGFNTLGGSTGDYLPIAPGSSEIVISVPKKGTSIDSLEVFKTTVQTTVGKRYSLHVTDTASRKSLLVDEDYSLPDTMSMRYRFVNLMPNVPSIDLYHGAVKVASNVAFMAITDSFVLPRSAALVSTVWTMRVGGSAANSPAVATYNNASTLLNQRVYTIFATGYNGYPTTGSDIRKPFLAFYYVR